MPISTQSQPRAQDLMTREVITVADELSAREAAELLLENEISGAPVVSAEGALIGVVTLTDLARPGLDDAGIAIDRSNPLFFARGWDDYFDPSDFAQLHLENPGRPVRDLMTTELYTVPDTATVPELAATMIQGHIHRVLVTRDGEVVGVISALDLVRLLVED